MPQHKSCKKRVKTNLKCQIRNRSARSALRKALRLYRASTGEERVAAYSNLQSILDKALGKGIIHSNRAARLKSRLTPS